MTTQAQIIEDERYSPFLDHGFVGIIDHMGSDESIEFSARMSYGEGTRSISDRRNLIRYLIRHLHMSPIEMAEVVFHIRVPIFVMRQLIRHRGGQSCNERSLRYSLPQDEYYVPDLGRIGEQSKDNKQGTGENLPENIGIQVQEKMQAVHDVAHSAYEWMVNECNVSRETARGVLPVSGYTEVVWKQDLRNFLHMVNLRTDPHAQWEIRQMAQLMYDKAKPLYPITCEAFEDYIKNSVTFSRMEMEILRKIVFNYVIGEKELEDLCEGILKGREKKEFFEKIL